MQDGPGTLIEAEDCAYHARFTRPAYRRWLAAPDRWVTSPNEQSVCRVGSGVTYMPHRVAGYAAVTLSLKKTGSPPGDATAEQMDASRISPSATASANCASRTSRISCSPTSSASKLYALWAEARAHGLATPNIGMLTNIIACPGGDFCSLANARSIPVAEDIQRRFDDLDYLYDIGELDLNISGCMNSCGHHHVGHIGILGVDKHGDEFYQVSIGGNQGPDASLGKVIGPSFGAEEVGPAIERLIECYLARRDSQRSRAIHRHGPTHRRRAVQGAVYGAPRAQRSRSRADSWQLLDTPESLPAIAQALGRIRLRGALPLNDWPAYALWLAARQTRLGVLLQGSDDPA